MPHRVGSIRFIWPENHVTQLLPASLLNLRLNIIETIRKCLHNSITYFAVLMELQAVSMYLPGFLHPKKVILSVLVSLIFCPLPTFPASPSPTRIMPIGHVQGIPTSSPHSHKSPYLGKSVTISGVIHTIIHWPDSRNDNQSLHGFFMQNLPANSDNDAQSSDGIFVFLGKYKNLYDGQKQIPVSCGLHVHLSGSVTEFHGSTQLVSPRVIGKPSRITDWIQKLNTPTAHPPSDQLQSNFYWESHESMMVKIPQGCLVTGPSKTISYGAESYVWVIAPDHPVAQRPLLQARRVFRDAHPLDDLPESLFDNENGYRIRLSSQALLSSAAPALISPANTFDSLTRSIYGAVHYSYGNYKVAVHSQPQWSSVSPISQILNINRNQTPDSQSFSVASYNIENLYDHRNDPEDPCDDHRDNGNESVSPPFNYLPESFSAYRLKLVALANQIAGPLHAPDLLMIQELEDQDIPHLPVTSNAGDLLTGSDGLPDVLQDLTAVLKKHHGISYAPASNRKGADARGITCGFMVNRKSWQFTSSSHLESLTLKHKDNPLPFNARIHIETADDGSTTASLQGTYRKRNSGESTLVYSRPLQIAVVSPVAGIISDHQRIYLLNNHFSSIPDQRIERRRNQASLAAAIARHLASSDPEAGIILGGDLNVFPEPDDGTPGNLSRQLKAIYRLNWDSVDNQLGNSLPHLNYTYIYEGQAQSLDHLFFSPGLAPYLHSSSIAHINVDYADSSQSPPPSDHEPVILQFLHSSSKR